MPQTPRPQAPQGEFEGRFPLMRFRLPRAETFPTLAAPSPRWGHTMGSGEASPWLTEPGQRGLR